MICSDISRIIGIECYPITDDGSIVMLDTPFSFADGDDIPVFAEKVAGHVRFFDDGGVLLHFMGRGLSFSDKRKSKFIKSAGEPNGVTLNDDGVLEIWTVVAEASAGFAKYISTLLAVVEWEKKHQNSNTDLSLFIDEVALCLRSWKKGHEIELTPTFTGVTGQQYALDFNVDGVAYIAAGSNPNTISAAIKKLLDIRSAPNGTDLKITAVVDDRPDNGILQKDGMVLQAVAQVLPFSDLERLAGTAPLRQ